MPHPSTYMASDQLPTLILPEMFLASETMGLAMSMSWSRSLKALLICVSVALAFASIDRSMPPIPERITRPEAEEDTGAARGTDSDGCAGACDGGMINTVTSAYANRGVKSI